MDAPHALTPEQKRFFDAFGYLAFPGLISDCIDEVTDLMWPTATQKGIGWSCEVDPLAAGEVLGDVHRLRQVLINLLRNAWQATRDVESPRITT